MKLTDFFKSLFGGAPVNAVNSGVDKIKASADAKDLTGVLTGITEIIVPAARIVEAASNTLKNAGDPAMSGNEKHEAVKSAVLEAIEPTVTKAVPGISGTTQEAFGGFMKALLGGVISILINAAVAKLNKETDGWKI